jgi:DNA-binding transcriptional LysR family regulator
LRQPADKFQYILPHSAIAPAYDAVVPTLRQLECFVAVVDQGSFTRAAATLHISQPALSMQVAGLERELGRPLFDRLPAGPAPTSTGRRALARARQALRVTSELVRDARATDAATLLGEVRVATVHSVSVGVLPALIRRWRRAAPQVDIALQEYRHVSEMHEAILRGDVDLVVGPRPAAWAGPIASLGTEHFVVLAGQDFLHADHADDRSVSIADLRDHRWIHFAPGHGLATVIDRACHAAGFIPRAAVRTEHAASAVALAGAGLGIALVPDNIVPATFAGRVLATRPPITRELSVYHRPHPDAVVAALARSAQEAATSGTRDAGR